MARAARPHLELLHACRLCRDEYKIADNLYATTLHVLSSAIMRLGKLTEATHVYRAPGRALPPSFWEKSKWRGIAGFIDTG